QRCFVGPCAAPKKANEDVRCNGHCFKADVKRHKVHGTHHEHHYHRGEQEESVILAVILPFDIEILQRNGNCQGSRNEKYRLEEPCEWIERQHSTVSRRVNDVAQPEQEEARPGQARKRDISEPALVLKEKIE